MFSGYCAAKAVKRRESGTWTNLYPKDGVYGHCREISILNIISDRRVSPMVEKHTQIRKTTGLSNQAGVFYGLQRCSRWDAYIKSISICRKPSPASRRPGSTKQTFIEEGMWLTQIFIFNVVRYYLYDMVRRNTFLQKHFLVLCRIGQVPFWRKIMYTDVIVPVPGGVWALKPVSEVSVSYCFIPRTRSGRGDISIIKRHS